MGFAVAKRSKANEKIVLPLKFMYDNNMHSFLLVYCRKVRYITASINYKSNLINALFWHGTMSPLSFASYWK